MKYKKIIFGAILILMLIQITTIVWANVDITDIENNTNINSISQTHENGIYKMLMGANLNKAIEVKGGYKNNNDILDIWDYGNTAWQKFYFEYQKEGYYKITAMHTGKSLTAENGRLSEGTAIVQADYQG